MSDPMLELLIHRAGEVPAPPARERAFMRALDAIPEPKMPGRWFRRGTLAAMVAAMMVPAGAVAMRATHSGVFAVPAHRAVAQAADAGSVSAAPHGVAVWHTRADAPAADATTAKTGTTSADPRTAPASHHAAKHSASKHSASKPSAHKSKPHHSDKPAAHKHPKHEPAPKHKPHGDAGHDAKKQGTPKSHAKPKHTKKKHAKKK